MTPAETLIDATDRIRDDALALLDAIAEAPNPQAVLNSRPAPGANPISWLLWHTGRVQDAQVAPLSGQPEVWLSGRHARRFDLDLPDSDTGYGHSAEQVEKVVVSSVAPLRAYLNASRDAVVEHLQTLGPGDLDQVVDADWDPPVTQGVRLVSVINDATQHVGQAAYAWGALGSAARGTDAG